MLKRNSRKEYKKAGLETSFVLYKYQILKIEPRIKQPHIKKNNKSYYYKFTWLYLNFQVEHKAEFLALGSDRRGVSRKSPRTSYLIKEYFLKHPNKFNQNRFHSFCTCSRVQINFEKYIENLQNSAEPKQNSTVVLSLKWGKNCKISNSIFFLRKKYYEKRRKINLNDQRVAGVK